MAEVYSRVASASLKKETTANTPVTPDTFFGLLEESMVQEYNYPITSPIKNNRAMNINSVRGQFPAPVGTIDIHVEPKTWGHFLLGIYGGISSGVYVPITSASGAFTAGETIDGAPSGGSSTVVKDLDSEALLVTLGGSPIEIGDTITGATSKNTATVGTFHSTAYGHAGTLPQDSLTSFTMQFNYVNNAIRFIGCRFHGLAPLNQVDNILMAKIQVMAQGQFRHAKVTAITSDGAGAKTITVDQTYGLVAGDTIKLYRPDSGYQDFSAASTKTHTITSITDELNFVVTNLQTATAVGDLIELAPQTASYTVGNEFPWIGGALGQVGAAIASLTTESMEDFNLSLMTELEARYAADGSDLEDHWPAAILEKACSGSGIMNAYYQNEEFYRLLRLNTAQAFRIKVTGDEIGSTNVFNQVWFTFPSVKFMPYQTPISRDNIVQEDIPFEAFYSDDDGYLARGLLVNDVASY